MLIRFYFERMCAFTIQVKMVRPEFHQSTVTKATHARTLMIDDVCYHDDNTREYQVKLMLRLSE